MDRPQDIVGLVDRLKVILSTQSLPSQLSSERSQPVLPSTVPPLPNHALTLPASSSTSPLEDLAQLLQSHILPYLNLSSLSPNYYGFITGGASPAALLADWLVSIYDQNVLVHLPNDTISTAVEVAALNLLVEFFNLPPAQWAVSTKGGGGGVLTTGATASNILGLACGREWVVQEAGRRKPQQTNGDIHHDMARYSIGQSGVLDACSATGVKSIQILSTLPHSSVVKAASVVGIGRNNIIPIGLETNSLHINVDKLEHLASSMRDQGKAYILAISAGEVNTGHFATSSQATMTRVREICDTHGIWIHVDAAFGLFGRVLASAGPEYDLVTKGTEGIELVDSITGDCHKLLNVPYDCGVFFTRHKRVSEMVFNNGSAAYLSTEVPLDDEKPITQNPMNIGIENSRRFRALPVWATLMAYGRQGYVDMLKRQIGLARKVVEWMWNVDGLNVLPSCETKEEALARTYMIVLFQAKDEDINERLVKTVNATGLIYVTGTKWEGKTAARIAVSNWQVNIERDLALIKKAVSQSIA